MSRSHKKLLPIGSNMNDAAYPFRGPYRVDDAINHGHSGIAKRTTTALALKVTGSNLVIEQLRVPKEVGLRCELAVDDGVPRAVTLGGGEGNSGVALAVPGDGHDYHLTALVQTDRGKHYCRMVFNGSEGQAALRLRAPTSGPVDAVQLYVDGKRVRAVGGWFTLPLRASDCSLVLSLPDDFGGTATTQVPQPSSMFLPNIFSYSRSPLHGGSDGSDDKGGDGSFILETVPGTSPTAQLQCMGSGQTISLRENSAAAIPTGAGPYRLQLPVPPVPPATVSPTPALGAPAASLTSAPPPVPLPVTPTRRPVPAVASPRQPVEIEARSHTGPGGEPAYTVTASGGGADGNSIGTLLEVRLWAENGTAAVGRGSATLSLPHRRAQLLMVEVVETAAASGPAEVVLLRQRLHVPAQEAPAVELRLLEEPGTGALVVRGGDGTRISVSPVGTVLESGSADGAARVDRSRGPHAVTVQQPNADGTVSTAVLRVDGSASAMSLPTLVPGAPIPSPISGAGDDAASAALAVWLAHLAGALQSHNAEEAQRAVSALSSPTATASTVTHFILEQLRRPLPSFELEAGAGGLTGVRCAGHDVTATVGSGWSAPSAVAPGGAVTLPPGSNVTLTAVRPGSTAPAATVHIGNYNFQQQALSQPQPQQLPTLTPTWPSPLQVASALAGGPGSGAEEALVARLVECLQRHNAEPARVADELAAISTTTLSAGGQRLVPLLVQCLRKAGAGAPLGYGGAHGTNCATTTAGTAEDILVTCGNGFLENIYTTQPHWQLTAAVDGQPAVPIPQRSRLPHGPTAAFPIGSAPHFVELTARDPLTGEVRRQLRLTVMGAAEVAPVRYALGGPPPLGQTATEATPASSSFPPQATTGGPADSRTPPDANTPVVAQVAQRSPLATGTTNAVAGADAGRVPYLDVSLTPVGDDIQVRCATRATHRIVCTVDGLGGDTGLAEFVTRVAAARHHRVELSVLDNLGKVAFQQRLEVPAVGSAAWGVALQDSGLALDPDGGCVATVSLDRAPERAVQGNYLTLDTSSPHFVVLRRYLNGVHGVKAGELALRVPAFVSDRELATIARLYRAHAGGKLDDGGLKLELMALRCQTATPAMRELMDALLAALQLISEQRDGSTAAAPAAAASGGAREAGLRASSGRVYFRLTGSD